MMTELFPAHSEKSPARTAVLLSGTGSNARVLLEDCRRNERAFRPVLLVTDNPESRAGELAREFDLSLAELDIRAFYASFGESSIKLDSPRRRELRDQWSCLLGEELKKHDIELVLFAGFIPMTNLTEKFPCLNVHPGDLTVTDPDGSRPFAGLHCKPVEEALCRNTGFTRSSVILARPYTGNGKEEMDSGPVVGVSGKIFFDLSPEQTGALKKLRSSRTEPPFRDELRRFALEHIDKMKVLGDHVIFPRAAEDFARGRFLCNDRGELFFREKGEIHPILSVEYTVDGKKLLERQM